MFPTSHVAPTCVYGRKLPLSHTNGHRMQCGKLRRYVKKVENMIPSISKTFILDKPVIYADLNVFRYIACNELQIVEPDRFIWVYSDIHLDEIHRNGNTDAIEGMQFLKAQEVKDVLDNKFRSVGDVQIIPYVDPKERYESYVETVSGSEETVSLFIEPLLTIFGANNLQELSQTPQKIIETVDRLTADADKPVREIIQERAKQASDDMSQSISEKLNKQFPIDKTRNAIGMTSEERKRLEGEVSPIEAIWDLIEPAMGGQDIDVMLGLSPNPYVEKFPHTQHGAITSAHTILNLIGYSPDTKLSNRQKIRNILSDADHVGMASYCQGLLSSDIRLCNKAQAIYQYVELKTNALHFVYDKNGVEVNLKIRRSSENAT